MSAGLEVLFLAGLLTRLGLLAPKPPTLEVVALDSRTSERIAAASVKVERLTKRERRGENFIFSVTVMAQGYNTAKEMVTLPYEAAGRVVSVTQRLEPLVVAPAVAQTASVVPEEPARTAETQRPQVRQPREVRGVVRRSDGTPIPAAVVRLVDAESGRVRAEVRSGPDGSYMFEVPSEGRWRVEAVAGRETTARRFLLEEVTPSTQRPAPVRERLAAVWRVASARDGRVVLAAEASHDAAGAVVGIRVGARTRYVGPDGSVVADPRRAAVWRGETVVLEAELLRTVFGGRPPAGFGLEVRSVWSNAEVAAVGQRLEVAMEDTLPPLPPSVEGFAVRQGVAEVRVRRAGEAEPLRYRVYLLEAGEAVPVHTTPHPTREEWPRLVFPWPERFRGRQDVTVAVTALDAAGNESEFAPSALPLEGEASSWDLFLGRGESVPEPAVEAPREMARPVRRRVPDAWERLAAAGWVVEGSVVLPGKSVRMPAAVKVVVRRGGRLTVEGAALSSDGPGRWGGFVVEGGTLVLRRCRLEDAEEAFRVFAGGTLVLEGCEVAFCGAAVTASDAAVEMRSVMLRRCGVSVEAQGGRFVAEGLEAVSNRHAPRLVGVRTRMMGSRLEGNGSPLVLVGGEAVVERTAVVGSRSDGVRLEGGSAEFRFCAFEGNAGHGVLVRPEGVSDPVFDRCDFVGNRRYAVTGGGRLSGCFVARNNGAWGVDTTPDRGSADGVRDSSSNATVMQVHAVDLLRGLSVSRNLEEGR